MRDYLNRMIMAAAIAAGASGIAFAQTYSYVDPASPAYLKAMMPDADGRVLNHLPYPAAVEAPASDLVSLDPALRLSAKGEPRNCQLRTPAAAAITAMIRAADAAAKPGEPKLRAFSCFRSIDYQKGTFCAADKDHPGQCREPVQRAKSSAPPGYSEHATGYTLDFTATWPAGTTPGCGDVSPCFADTAPGKWLLAHGRDYGFELSFPCQKQSPGRCESNQGVTYEPWHWRWVGTKDPSGKLSDAAKAARAVLARARKCFPASPGIDATPPPASIPDCLKSTRP